MATFVLAICLSLMPGHQASAQTGLHLQSAVPLEDAILFVSPAINGPSLGLFKAPDGMLALVPVNQVKLAMESGYQPFRAGDLLQAIGEQQKRLTDLNDDYNNLVERFNRLAATTSTPKVDPRQAMRMMLFQSLLNRAFPPTVNVNTRVQVADCTTYPALCAAK